MILRTSPRASRGLLFLSLIASAFLVYFSIRNARAAHAVELNTRAGYEKAARLEPGNARNWFLLGSFYQNDFENADPEAALRALLVARSLDPLSSETLLALATNYSDAGKFSDARATYAEAERAAPMSAEVHWSYGNFLLRQNEIPAAFSQIKIAVQLDPKRSAEAFSRCHRVVPDVGEILDNVIPRNLEAYLDIIFDLTNDGQLDVALSVWSRAAALPGTLEVLDVTPLTNALLQNNRPRDAALLWHEAMQKLKKPIPPDVPGSILWDGGFEAGFSHGGLGWFYQPLAKGVQIQTDPQEKHSGEQSLRLIFTSRTNLAFDDICHVVVGEPGKTYEFSAWIKTKSVTSNEGPRFVVAASAGNKIFNAHTDDVHGDQPWTKVSLTWTQPQGTETARVCAARYQSDLPDGEIAGTAWIDDVSFVPVPAEHANR